ncbi:single-stranded DNA-binding protein [Fodinisporobacter ferrooxydans]|uniref:Single-stranded DNA-binding protein n=1 Tax=Fodinisporobacter ferrooxydans TaxID=2901836 RepID=A0ABY4CPF6_9BACL|nr:single-stranded DNA-binding protein [Alicyclobacillaceae bacterium MYW30-H2]
MLNRVILIGRLTADPELKYTPNGIAVANFTLAVDRARANQNGEREADFIPVVVWQKAAEASAQYLKKGKMAAVDGHLQIRSYENKEGQRVRVAEVVAENVRFLSPADHNGSGGNGQVSQNRQPQPSYSGGTSGHGGGGYSSPNPFSDPFGDGRPVDLDSDDLPF